MMTFNDFIKNIKMKNKPTSNMKIYENLSSLGLGNVGIFLRDGPFETDTGLVNLHSSKGTHWVCYTNEIYFDRYRGFCPKKL